MSGPSSRTFLDLKSYRHKRLVDAAKLLPLFGTAGLLFPFPFFFIEAVSGQSALPLALYLFFAWLALILSAFLLSRHLQLPGDGG